MLIRLSSKPSSQPGASAQWLKRALLSKEWLPFSSIDHVQLAMPEGREDRARRFYVSVLGMSELRKPPELLSRGGVWFQSGEVFLHLGVEAEFRAAKKAHPAFRCCDYDALLQRLQSHEIVISIEKDLIERSRHCYVADPFGNRLELIEDD